jgi:hypothetical protein
MAETARVYVMPGPIGDRKVYLVRKEEKEEPGHPALEISVSLQDSVHWVSRDERKFSVIKLKAIKKGCDILTDEESAIAPRAFYRRFPDDNQDHEFQISSGPARPEAIGYTYEAHFDFEDGSQCDPHLQVNPLIL